MSRGSLQKNLIIQFSKRKIKKNNAQNIDYQLLNNPIS